MTDEIEYLPIKVFCSKHRYPITQKLLEAAEHEIIQKCKDEHVRIKITNYLGTGRVSRAYPRWILEEYFLLWIK
jgi:hypothetical protein